MAVLLVAEHDNKSLKDATSKALTAARQIGGDVHVLVAGHNCRPAAEAAAKLEGVTKVLLADAPAYEHMLAEPTAALIVSLAVLPKTALIFQPLFQGAVVLAIGVAILAIANAKAKSRGENFRSIAATLPVE